MRTSLTPQMATAVVAVLLVASPFTSSVATTSPQRTFAESFFQVPVKQVNAPILVRNSDNKTVSKSDDSPAPVTAVSAKDSKVEDKKTMGRCWKRLMNMIREVNHAHRIKKTPVQ